MKFCCFNPMPWKNLSERPRVWPFPNDEFDPKLCETLYSSYIEQLVFAEECGFDWVGLGEDHMTAYSVTPNPNLILAILSQRTRRVRLAILGCPLPLHNPIRTAEECAMLDILSGGRLVVGFIRGVPQNYAAYNVDPNESRERFAEANDLILKSWTADEIFEWSGKYYNFPTVSLWPTPLQKPPPIVYSANSETSAIYAAQRRATIGAIHLYNRNALELVKKAYNAYRTEASDARWQPEADRFLLGLQTCIAETDEEARKSLEPALDYQYNVLSGTYNAEKRRIAAQTGYGLSPVEENPPTLDERLAYGIVLCGSPQTVIDQIEQLHDELGAGIISMHFQVGNISDATVRKGMQLFSDFVLPHFR